MNSLFGFDAASLWSKNSNRKRKSGSGLTSGTNLPADIAKSLGDAETSYVRGEYDQAIQLLSDVTKKAPRLAEPYSILALIYEETGDQKHALQLYALAAAFSKRNLELWRKVLSLSMQMGEYQQAAVALARCLALSKTAEQDFGHIRIVLTAMLGQYRQLHEMIKSHMTKNPDDLMLLEKVVEMMIEMGYHQKAIKYATQYLSSCYINSHDTRLNIQMTEDQADDIVINLPSITVVVRSLALLYIEKVQLLDAIKLLENAVLVFNVAFRNCSMRDEEFVFPHELSLLLGYITLRLGSAKEDEQMIDRGLQILQPSIASIMSNPAVLVESVLSSGGTDDQPDKESSQIDRQELDSVGATLQILFLIAKKMAEQNMKMRSTKIIDFIIQIVRELTNKGVARFLRATFLLQLAKYLQFQQRHDVSMEMIESCLICDIFLGEALQLYAVEALDHHAEKVPDVMVVLSWNLRMLLDESHKIRTLLSGSGSSKMFGKEGDDEGDEEVDEDDDEDEDEDEEDAEDEVGNDEDDDADGDDDDADDRYDDEEYAAEKSPRKRSKAKKRRNAARKDAKAKAKAKAKATEAALALSTTMNAQAVVQEASLPVTQESTAMVVDDDDEEEDFTDDMDLFLLEQSSTSVTTSRQTSLQTTEGSETETAGVSTVAGPPATSLLLLSESFLGMEDPVFQQSFPLTNLTRQNSAASAVSQSESSIHAQAGEQASSTLRTNGDNRLFASLFVAARAHPSLSLGEMLLQVFAPSDDSTHLRPTPLQRYKSFSPWHARHSFHRQVLHNILHSLCTYLFVLAKQIQGQTAHTAWLTEDEDLLPMLGWALVQGFTRILSRRLKTRETIPVRTFIREWQAHEQLVRTAPSTYLMAELHRIFNRNCGIFSSSSTDNSSAFGDLANDRRWEEKVSLAALIHTLCDFIPLESIIDREYLETLVSCFSVQYEQLQVSTTLQREILLRQQDVFRQQCSHLGHVEETLQHRRRHRAAWLSPSLVAVAAAAISTDTMSSLTPNEGAMGGKLTNIVSSHRLTRNHLRRTLFSQESWLQAASMISSEVLTAATELWQQPDDVNIANWLFRLLVDEAYGADGNDVDKLERTFVSTEIYMENRLPIRTLALELPEAGSKSAVAQFLAGHDFALVRKHQEAVDAYLNAFLLSPDEPLIALTLSGYFLLLATHPLFKARYDNLLRAMCFLVHYQKQRRAKPLVSDSHGKSTSETIRSEVTLYQETLYNLAKLFHDLRLHHLAVANYRKVLELYDDYLAPGKTPGVTNVTGVTREAAHNLVLLYRLSQSKALALSIMMKYLRFE